MVQEPSEMRPDESSYLGPAAWGSQSSLVVPLSGSKAFEVYRAQMVGAGDSLTEVLGYLPLMTMKPDMIGVLCVSIREGSVRTWRASVWFAREIIGRCCCRKRVDRDTARHQLVFPQWLPTRCKFETPLIDSWGDIGDAESGAIRTSNPSRSFDRGRNRTGPEHLRRGSFVQHWRPLVACIARGSDG
jgi:hypothetical protein